MLHSSRQTDRSVSVLEGYWEQGSESADQTGGSAACCGTGGSLGELPPGSRPSLDPSRQTKYENSGWCSTLKSARTDTSYDSATANASSTKWTAHLVVLIPDTHSSNESRLTKKNYFKICHNWCRSQKHQQQMRVFSSPTLTTDQT